MENDARTMRGSGPTLFAQAKNNIGIAEIINHILAAKNEALTNHE